MAQVASFASRGSPRAAAALAFLAAWSSLSSTRADSPFATGVVSFTPGMGAAPGFANPLVALGSPERFTGEGLLPQVVTPFQPAFRPDEIVSIGLGGSLVLAFDHDVLDDPGNPFGIDLLVFGNSFCVDAASPAGVVGGIFGEGGGVSVSADGSAWTSVPVVAADGPFPTLGWLDVGPYATAPGSVPSEFTRPVDPSLGGLGLVGFDWTSLQAAYAGSGGGAGIDLAAIGLAAIRFVRIEGSATFGISPEIDAVADVAPLPPAADLNADSLVDAADLAILLGAWATSGPGDLDGDGVVGGSDLAILLGAWS